MWLFLDMFKAESDWEFWGELASDFDETMKKKSKAVADRVYNGIPSELRGMVWLKFARKRDTSLEARYGDLLKVRDLHSRSPRAHAACARLFPFLSLLCAPLHFIGNVRFRDAD